MAAQDNLGADDQRLDELLPDSIVRLILAIRGSLMNFIAALGVAMLLLGAFGPKIPGLRSVVGGAPAGLLGILGASAVVYAGIGHLFMYLIGYK